MTGGIGSAVAGVVLGRAVDRLLSAPRTLPDEAELGPRLDALGGEVVRLRSRDGTRLFARWLPAEATPDGWLDDPHEAILLLHGWNGSCAPDLVEYGPFLRRTAGVLGLDFGGHGGSDEALTTFGPREVEDVAGALAWFGERGITRVAMFGTSLGGIVAIASAVVLGDGSLASADAAADVPATQIGPPRPRLVGIVADSVAPELPVAVAGRVPGPFGRLVGRALFAAAARRIGEDPRALEPIRLVGLLEGLPLLLVQGTADRTVPTRHGRRLVAAAAPGTESWEVAGAGHAGAHAADPAAYEERVTGFLRAAFLGPRGAVP